MRIQADRLAAFFLAATIIVVLIGSLTIAMELIPSVREVLNSLTINHWLTKSVMIAILFPLLSAMLYAILGNARARTLLRAERVKMWTAILITLTLAYIIAIFGYYVAHYLG